MTALMNDDPVDKKQGNGMSRAAKKRAKKKSKKDKVEASDQHAPTEKRQRDDPVVKNLPAAKVPKHTGESLDTIGKIQQTPISPVYDDGPPERIDCLTDILEVEPESPLSQSSAKDRASLVVDFLFGPSGVSSEKFYETYWEKQPLCVQAKSEKHRKRFDGLLSKKSIAQSIEQHTHYYGRDLNVTRYERQADGVKRRVTLDLVASNTSEENTGEDNLVAVDPESLWSNFDKGCTVRLLCPHKHSDTTHTLLSLMESEWSCMVGANAYLTPPSGAQGFAPHYDDIEAFCLQLEGQKRWKVYAPLKKSERLPRTSSEDFVEDTLRDHEPFLDIVLEPGDILYMPRGWIHQACTIEGDNCTHSLHLTMSAMQQWAWIDLMDILIPEAMDAAASGDSTMLRQGLPRGFLDYMGGMHDQSSESEVLKEKEKADREVQDDDPGKIDAELERKLWQKAQSDAFRVEAKKKIMKIAKEAMDMIDATCDEMGKRFLSDRLPPALTTMEKATTNSESNNEILPQTMCRISRPGCARLVVEDGKAVLYHCADNSRVYHELPLSPMEFELDDAPAIEQLLTTNEYEWVRVADLIHDSIDDKVSVVKALFDEGILCIQTQSL